jgi:hypothetical protein
LQCYSLQERMDMLRAITTRMVYLLLARTRLSMQPSSPQKCCSLDTVFWNLEPFLNAGVPRKLQLMDQAGTISTIDASKYLCSVLITRMGSLGEYSRDHSNRFWDPQWPLACNGCGMVRQSTLMYDADRFVLLMSARISPVYAICVCSVKASIFGWSALSQRSPPIMTTLLSPSGLISTPPPPTAVADQFIM